MKMSTKKFIGMLNNEDRHNVFGFVHCDLGNNGYVIECAHVKDFFNVVNFVENLYNAEIIELDNVEFEAIIRFNDRTFRIVSFFYD